MSPNVSSAEIERAYEALRARATGGAPAETPRGLTVLLARGLAAWMSSLAPAATTMTTSLSSPATSASAPTSELASLLAEMALAGRRCAA